MWCDACRDVMRLFSCYSLNVYAGALRALQAGLKDAAMHPSGAHFLAATVPEVLIDELALLAVSNN